MKKGSTISEETRRKMSESAKKRGGHTFSNEARKKMSLAKFGNRNAFKGKRNIKIIDFENSIIKKNRQLENILDEMN